MLLGGGWRRHSKNTKKRQRQVLRVASRTTVMKIKDVGPVFPAVQLLNDPQGLAEKMFRNLKGVRWAACLHCCALSLSPLPPLRVLAVVRRLRRETHAHELHRTRAARHLPLSTFTRCCCVPDVVPVLLLLRCSRD